MKFKPFVLAIFFLLIFIFNYSISEARSGCCSHHGGVCGCGCCDGSDLSAKCAPYYPECSSSYDSYTSNSVNTYSTPETSTYTAPVNLNSETASPTPVPSTASYSNNDLNIPEPEKASYSEPVVAKPEIVEEKENVETPVETTETNTQTGTDSANDSQVINETSVEKPEEDSSSTGLIVLILTGLGIYFFRKKK